MDLSRIGVYKIILLGHLSTYTSVICQQKELIILKLDFEKAFDKVEHKVILQVLKDKGFSRNGFHGLKVL
jgi:hypothetical protein